MNVMLPILIIIAIIASVILPRVLIPVLRLKSRTRQYHGRTVIITGASRGIGKAFAIEAARRGANIVLASRRENALHQAAEACQQANPAANTLVVKTDVTIEADRQNLITQAQAHFGQVDILINNAGIVQGGNVQSLGLDAYTRHIDVNLIPPIHLTQLVLEVMQSQPADGLTGIINLSALMGRHALPYMSPYTTSKFALTGFSESVRRELHKTGIHVLTVFVGFADTQMVSEENRRLLKPFGVRVLTPEKVAKRTLNAFLLRKPEVIIGGTEFLAVWIGRFSPRLADWMWETFMPDAYEEEAARQRTE